LIYVESETKDFDFGLIQKTHVPETEQAMYHKKDAIRKDFNLLLKPKTENKGRNNKTNHFQKYQELIEYTNGFR